MVRSILFPKPINIKYERDGVKFIGMMAIVGVVGFTFSIVISIYECLTIPATILKSLDLGKSYIQSIFKVRIMKIYLTRYRNFQKLQQLYHQLYQQH